VKILVQDKQGVRALEEGFASEEELQTFLKEHPDLMPLEEIELDAPGLLCIGWEVGLASGAEDILYIDQNGLLTVVETKLRRNPEARREVVGQILEYAAQMSTWSSADVERQAQKFFASPEAPEEYRDCALEKALQRFQESRGVPPDFSYDDFLQQVQTNIDRGRFRLVIAIDEPPEPLLETVEFVNRFSERFEMFLVQLKRFRDLAREQNIFVPALFGKVAGTRPPRTRWDEGRFVQHLRASGDMETVDYTLQIYERFKAWTDEPYWGSGVTIGSFNLLLLTRDARVNVAQITSRGDLYINFGSLTSKIPEGLIRALARELRQIKGIALPSDLSNKYPSLPNAVLKDAARREQVLKALLGLVEGIRSAND